jgi:prepilin-type N-terminal cleavage/methylation domain-containing protein
MAYSRPRHSLPARAASSAPGGFTLIELLVTLSIGSVLAIGTVFTLNEHFRTTSLLQARNRLQDHWARVNLLLETEIAEADTITTDGTCGGVNSLLTLNVRSADQVNSTAAIRYAVNGNGDLVRCGPPVAANGALDFAATATTSRLVPNAQFQVQLPGSPPTGRLPTYTLTLTDPPSGTTYANQGSANRARVRVIN